MYARGTRQGKMIMRPRTAKKTFVIQVTLPEDREIFAELEKIHGLQTGRSAFDYFDDMYVMPEQVRLRPVRSGRLGFVQDAQNIKGYFRKSLSEVA